MAARRLILPTVYWLLLLPSLASCGTEGHEMAGEVTRAAALPTCFDSTAALSWEDEGVTATFEGVQLPAVIEHIDILGFPVSFIEGPSPVRIEMRSQNLQARSFLKELLEQAPGYRCSVIGNHAVVYFDDPALHKVVSDVSIAQKFRGPAARSYVKHVSHEIEELKDLGVLLGGPLDSPVFNEEVTLAPEATVLEHLGQLLGENPDIIFWIRYASTGNRYLNFGSVFRRGEESRVQREERDPAEKSH